jgi:accessory gene regulator B
MTLLVFAAAIYISAVFILKKWAPADTPHKLITEPEEIRKFKRLSLLHVSVWFPLMLVLLYFNLNMYVLSGCFGVLMSIFIVTPVGYGLFDKLSGRLDKFKAK